MHHLMHLSLVDVKTVQELSVQCKKIEEMNAMRNRFKSGVPKTPSVIESELMYVDKDLSASPAR